MLSILAEQLGLQQPHLPENFFLRYGAVASVKHVGPRSDDSACSNFRIIGGQEAAFTRIDVLVGLGGKAADFAEVPGADAFPSGTHCVGAVFDQSD